MALISHHYHHCPLLNLLVMPTYFFLISSRFLSICCSSFLGFTAFRFLQLIAAWLSKL
jgi:hypothetical protein